MAATQSAEEYVWISKAIDLDIFTTHAHPVMHQLGQEWGVKVTIAGPPGLGLEDEPFIQAVYDAVERKAAGILLHGWGVPAEVDAINTAIEHGVPVVTVDSDVPNSKRLAHVGTDWSRMGAAMADQLAGLIGRGGKVLYMGNHSLANIRAGFRGFQHRLHAYPAVEVFGPEDDSGAKDCYAITMEWLRQHPDLKGVAGFDFLSGPDIARALEETGMAGKVKLVCVDAETLHIEYVRRGTIQAAFSQRREYFTYQAFQLLYAYNHGTASNGYKPGPSNIVGNIDTGFTIVTMGNLESFENDFNLNEVIERNRLTRRLALMSAVAESSEQMMLAVDGEQRVIYANPCSLQLSGMAEARMIGASLDQIFDLTEAHRLSIERGAAAGTPVRFETSARRANADGFPVQLTISPLKTDSISRGLVVVAADISERKQAEAERLRLQGEVIEAQRQALQELSTPIIPIMNQIIVMPLVGGIDTTRSQDIMRSLLEGISQYRAKIAILDITGVPIVDSGVAEHLNHTMQAAKLKGAYTIVTGVSDAVAEAIVDLGIDWSGVETLRDLQSGLLTALKRLGLRVERQGD